MNPPRYIANHTDFGHGKVWTVSGPWLAGGLHGTVPKHSAAMTKDDAVTLSDLLNTAYRAGEEHAKRDIRQALGIDKP